MNVAFTEIMTTLSLNILTPIKVKSVIVCFSLVLPFIPVKPHLTFTIGCLGLLVRFNVTSLKVCIIVRRKIR